MHSLLPCILACSINLPDLSFAPPPSVPPRPTVLSPLAHQDTIEDRFLDRLPIALYRKIRTGGITAPPLPDRWIGWKRRRWTKAIPIARLSRSSPRLGCDPPGPRPPCCTRGFMELRQNLRARRQARLVFSAPLVLALSRHRRHANLRRHHRAPVGMSSSFESGCPRASRMTMSGPPSAHLAPVVMHLPKSASGACTSFRIGVDGDQP